MDVREVLNPWELLNYVVEGCGCQQKLGKRCILLELRPG